MISTFNIGKLRSLLHDFYTITRIRITVFDDTFRELTAYPDDPAPICQLLRTDPFALQQCQRCDLAACEAAAHRHTAHIYRCHAGLTESIVPLYMGNIVIGYLFFGHGFCYASHEEGWEVIREKTKTYDVEEEKLREACWERPLISEEYIDSASHILQAVSSYLCLEQMATIRRKDLPVQIDEYINENFTKAITAQSICEHFRIGKTTLYEIAQESYGIGIAAHIRNLRIDKAKSFLTFYPEKRIGEIADACGFQDYNYFITVFKRMTGMSPGQYRQETRKELI